MPVIPQIFAIRRAQLDFPWVALKEKNLNPVTFRDLLRN